MRFEPDLKLTPQVVLYICMAAYCGSTDTDIFLADHSRLAALCDVNVMGNVLWTREPWKCGALVPDCHARACAILVREHQTTAFLEQLGLKRAIVMAPVQLSADPGSRLPSPRMLSKVINNVDFITGDG